MKQKQSNLGALRKSLEFRMQELSKALTDSAENHQRLKMSLDNATNVHNALAGRFEEAKELYQKLEKEEVENPIST